MRKCLKKFRRFRKKWGFKKWKKSKKGGKKAKKAKKWRRRFFRARFWKCKRIYLLACKFLRKYKKTKRCKRFKRRVRRFRRKAKYCLRRIKRLRKAKKLCHHRYFVKKCRRKWVRKACIASNKFRRKHKKLCRRILRKTKVRRCLHCLAGWAVRKRSCKWCLRKVLYIFKPLCSRHKFFKNHRRFCKNKWRRRWRKHGKKHRKHRKHHWSNKLILINLL